MSLDKSSNTPFSPYDSHVLEAVEKQYLYGRTKSILKNLEEEILNITKDITRSNHLEIPYADHLPTMQLIGIALSRLGKRHFSESDMKSLDAFKKRCHGAMNNLMDMFDFNDVTGYGKAASDLLGAVYALTPPPLSNHDSANIAAQHDSMSTAVFGKVLAALDTIDTAGAKLKRAGKKVVSINEENK